MLSVFTYQALLVFTRLRKSILFICYNCHRLKASAAKLMFSVLLNPAAGLARAGATLCCLRCVDVCILSYHVLPVNTFFADIFKNFCIARKRWNLAEQIEERANSTRFTTRQ